MLLHFQLPTQLHTTFQSIRYGSNTLRSTRYQAPTLRHRRRWTYLAEEEGAAGEG